MEEKQIESTIKILKAVSNCTAQGSDLSKSGSSFYIKDSESTTKKIFNNTKEILDVATKSLNLICAVLIAYKAFIEIKK